VKFEAHRGRGNFFDEVFGHCCQSQQKLTSWSLNDLGRWISGDALLELPLLDKFFLGLVTVLRAGVTVGHPSRGI